MDFRIADTFTDSLARLTGDEQKAVKTTAFDLQVNPANPGMRFHRAIVERCGNRRKAVTPSRVSPITPGSIPGYDKEPPPMAKMKAQAT